jgi:addiction module HigA family antidote
VSSRRARRTCPAELWPAIRRKLTQLNRVQGLSELRIPPGNRLKRLRGDRAGQYSIRVNEQYRICFRWEDGYADEVEVTEFLKPLGISQSAFARQLDVSFPRLNEIINGKRGVTTDTALRLARVTGMSPEFWLGLQQDWDLWHALRSEEANDIARLTPLAELEDVAR